MTQYIWFILFLFLDFMQIVCLRLMATAANLCMQIDSPLCWVRLLWSAAICIWKWSGLEWAWGEVQLGMMGKRELATISWKLCLPKCLQQHTSPTLCNFPFLFLYLSFYVRALTVTLLTELRFNTKPSFKSSGWRDTSGCGLLVLNKVQMSERPAVRVPANAQDHLCTRKLYYTIWCLMWIFLCCVASSANLKKNKKNE